MSDPAPIRAETALEERRSEAYIYRWPSSGFGMTFASVNDDKREGPEAEVHSWMTHEGKRLLIHSGRLRLQGTNSKRDLARLLQEQTKGVGIDGKIVDWKGLIEGACRRTVLQHREGEPVVSLADIEPKQQSFVLAGIIPTSRTTLLIGDGASTKSTQALAMALAVVLGRDIGPYRPLTQGPVLYLDAETEDEEQAERAFRICKSIGVDKVPKDLYYQRVLMSMGQAREGVKRAIAKTGAIMVIMDSAGAVAGGTMNDDQVAIGLTNALRTLGDVTRLLISHVSKATAAQETGRGRVYGNVYFENYARSIIEARREGTHATDFLVGLYHRKMNRGALREAIAVRMRYDDPMGPITLEESAISVSPELSAFGNPSDAIAAALMANGGALDSTELATITGLPPTTLRRRLEREPDRFDVVGGGRGRGNHSRVILRSVHQPDAGG